MLYSYLRHVNTVSCQICTIANFLLLPSQETTQQVRRINILSLRLTGLTKWRSELW